MDEAIKKAIETYQCPGCVAGSNTKCGAFKQGYAPTSFECTAHVPGTAMSRIGTIMLGMPKGFCRVGPRREDKDSRHTVQIHPKFPDGWFNEMNVAACKYRDPSGVVHVRGLHPRINLPFQHLILECSDEQFEAIGGTTWTEETLNGMD